MNASARPIHLLVVLVSALALAIVPGASPAAKPLLQLGPITVANGIATISGTVSSRSARTTLRVNGRPLALDAAGAFNAVVALDRATAIAIAIGALGGRQQTEYVIPLTGALLRLGGVIPVGVLDSLERAGITLLAPVLGPSDPVLTVQGAVLDPTQLVSLTVNGVNVLGLLQPNGSFSTQLPGSTTVVTVTARDASGTMVRETTHVFRPARLGTVTATQAIGLRIAKVRFVRKGTARTGRLRMIVTVKDRRGRLVQGAKIRVRATRAGRLVRQPRVASSGPRGRTTFVLRLRKAAHGKRLVLVTVGRTPRAKAVRRSAVYVPSRRTVHR